MTQRPLRVWTAVVDLTPSCVVAMGGHGGAPRLTSAPAHGRLEANIVAFERAGEDVAVLVALDAVFAGASVTAAVTSACARRFGCDESHVMVLASHTHSAPMLDEKKPLLGRADPVEVKRWGHLIGAAFEYLDCEIATEVAVARGASNLAVNRRLRWSFPTLVRLLGKASDDVYICDNPSGPRDPRIRIVVWRDGSRPIALMWTFACHPSGFPQNDRASPDFVGVVRAALRARYGEALPIIFAPGCMGDVRPVSPSPWFAWRRWGLILMYGPQPVAYSLSEWTAWADRLGAEVVATCERAAVGNVETTIRAHAVRKLPLASIFSGRCPVQHLVGKSLDLPGAGRVFSLTCEPVTQIAELIDADPEAWVLGYEGDAFGYLPTSAMVREGGYEAERFKSHFSMQGHFIRDLDAVISKLGRSLAGNR